MSLQFDHIAIGVSDVRAARELFEQILELPLLDAYSGDDWDGAPWLMMIFGLGQARGCGAISLTSSRARMAPHIRARKRSSRWRTRGF